MIKIKAFGYSTNGDAVFINLDEPQRGCLREIIKVYREQLCGDRQDIRECEKLLELINKETMPIEMNERQFFNLLQVVDGYRDEMCCDRKSKRECKELLKFIQKQAV